MLAYLDFDDIFIEICGDEKQIDSILFKTKKGIDDYTSTSQVALALSQLKEYFALKRTNFELNLNLKTTPFNEKVYNQLRKVDYGTLASYKDIAQAVDSPKAYRAVGNANNKNNFVIVIPCHRIIGSNNNLVGFAPGLRYKKILIELEKSNGGYNG